MAPETDHRLAPSLEVSGLEPPTSPLRTALTQMLDRKKYREALVIGNFHLPLGTAPYRRRPFTPPPRG